MDALNRTRLAVLGTLSDLHRQRIAYDLDCLRQLLVDLSPDLLCAEITREAWEGGDLASAALEVRDAFVPVIETTEIVLVPVLPDARPFADFAPSAGWRRNVVRGLHRALRRGQRAANRPDAVNGFLFVEFCHAVCVVTERVWSGEERAAWESQNRKIALNIARAVERDAGRRVLVAVQCERLHRLLPMLRAHAELFQIVGYREL